MSGLTEHQVPEGYKQTEVGIIPEDWVIKYLSQITLDMLQGVNTAIDIPEYVEDGIPMLKANNVIDQFVKFQRCDSISQKTYDGYSNRFKLKRNDFLFSNIGARLGTGSLLDEDVECSFAWNVMRIVPDQKKVEPRFLAFQINAPKNSEKIKSEQSGSGMGFIPKSTMLKVQLPIPKSLEEQSAIANALSDVDALITSLEKLITKKRAIKTAAMQQLLTGKKRLPPFDQTHTGYKQTELGRIPNDWEVIELGLLAHIKTGTMNNQDKVKEGLYPFFVRSQNVEEINSFSYECEAILIPGEGNIGNIFHYINGRFDAHQRVYVIRHFKEECSAKFIFYYMKENFGRHAMENSVKATVDSLRLPTFLEFKVAKPQHFGEQAAISDALSDMDKDIDGLEQRLNKTQQLKQGMMQELLTGRTRLI